MVSQYHPCQILATPLGTVILFNFNLLTCIIIYTLFYRVMNSMLWGVP